MFYDLLFTDKKQSCTVNGLNLVTYAYFEFQKAEKGLKYGRLRPRITEPNAEVDSVFDWTDGLETPWDFSDSASFVFHVKQVQNCYFYKIRDYIELKRNFVKTLSFFLLSRVSRITDRLGTSSKLIGVRNERAPRQPRPDLKRFG